MFLLLLFFVPHSRSMGLNVLGYQSHFLQRCPLLPIVATKDAQQVEND